MLNILNGQRDDRTSKSKSAGVPVAEQSSTVASHTRETKGKTRGDRAELPPSLRKLRL